MGTRKPPAGVEAMRCPQNPGPGTPLRTGDFDDWWETDRWTADHDAAEAKRQAFRDEFPTGSISATAEEWLGPGDVPRTCSYCGGIHPEDAIALLDAGWESEGTDKGYKRYLQPPGTAQKRRAWMARFDRGEAEPLAAPVPSVWSPVPPVKLYTYHFTQEQADRFNAIWRARLGGEASS